MDPAYEINAPDSPRTRRNPRDARNKCEDCLIADGCRTCRMERKMNVMADEIRFLKNMVHMLCLKDIRDQSRHDSEKSLEEAVDNIGWLKIIVDAQSSQLSSWKKTHEKHLENFKELSSKVDGLVCVREQVQKVIEELNRLKTVVDNPTSLAVSEIEESAPLNGTDGSVDPVCQCSKFGPVNVDNTNSLRALEIEYSVVSVPFDANQAQLSNKEMEELVWNIKS